MGCHFKGASGSGTGLLKDQRYILATFHILCQHAIFLFLLQICCQINKIQDLFLCKIKQLQKVSSL